MPDKEFCSVENYSVLIPYRDLVKIADLAKNYELMEARYKRMEEMYSGIYGMFSEVLQIVRETRDFVRDT